MLGEWVSVGSVASPFTARELIGWVGTLVLLEHVVKTRGTSSSSAFAVSIGRWSGVVVLEPVPLALLVFVLTRFDLVVLEE